ncbi:DUF4127 family protein [Enterococcus sp. DIV0242_7C1]|uniref:DUF4127 family protein n=1 Tax=Candidatus Enterococcus dunnyi TaxID=1834192 RepID=A0A200JEX8_9ENTE|nr:MULTISPECIES: DUF4127 family protein [unclassified Enterococcus]MBO0469459.1 DUF4127 family protein [Enterococcus sp. DIV0242_7C1]OUZ35245.1 hypothetical protein A5889_000721 [Enterococcus sp. 9D6_DIV0238]
MLKIVYIPLDERPCNADYPLNAAAVSKEIQCTMLPKERMGNKKKPGDLDAIWQFINEAAENSDAAVISTEMVLYGGLLASRLHELKEAALLTYEKRIRSLKKTNPRLKIYASNLIMRTPKYNSSDEEPEYYEEYGERIFRYGWLLDKKTRESLDADENLELDQLKQELPIAIIKDYEDRRSFNVKVNLLNIRLVEEGVIDFLVIPQDDSAAYGYTAMDQKKVYHAIEEKNLKDQIMVYPGADEVGFTLLARAYNQYKNKVPTVYVQFSSTLGPEIVPLYEDRIINESLKAHVMAAGMRLTKNQDSADYYLAYNTPGKVMQESWDQLENKDVTYDSYRHLMTFVDEIACAAKSGKIIGICDSAYANGGDRELLQLLDKLGLINQLSVYKAWNTNCNSLGSALGALALIDEQVDHSQLMNNLYSNLFEDIFYQALIRMDVTENYLPQIDANYFDLKDQVEAVLMKVESEMNHLEKRYLKKSLKGKHIEFTEMSSPWNRMFEINCQVRVTEGE